MDTAGQFISDCTFHQKKDPRRKIKRDVSLWEDLCAAMFFLDQKSFHCFRSHFTLASFSRPENMAKFGAFSVKTRGFENHIEHITKKLGIDSISLFANSTVSTEEVRSVLLADSLSFSNLRDLAAVRKAWRVAETMEKELHQPLQPRNIASFAAS